MTYDSGASIVANRELPNRFKGSKRNIKRRSAIIPNQPTTLSLYEILADNPNVPLSGLIIAFVSAKLRLFRDCYLVESKIVTHLHASDA
ncbi:hypothetical protein PR003_g17589 [Phytophthora rubi]|uniref:Uncharacterized protein n=1 Tax=Phytophthora rubi TaxID=129364 RepID=A0A6A4ELI5_9STRA|nr:hypothetical protein PR001_g12956 [Phytophthora rubi]KAE9037009.1 hypothetical protein PR002_g6794 [Phytophthora rubi]KAE9320936.1 hypothetical protein PR003_g17589 [Phytophthora rubi]